MVLAPEARGKGLAHTLFREVLDDLRRRGVAYVVAFGHRLGPTYSSPLAELPESVCRKAGMSIERDDPECPRYGMALGSQL
jgi:GNAT superfamily N-acetyltransferase